MVVGAGELANILHVVGVTICLGIDCGKACGRMKNCLIAIYRGSNCKCSIEYILTP